MTEKDDLDKYSHEYFSSRGILKKGMVTLNHYWCRYFKSSIKKAPVQPRLLDLGCGSGKLLLKIEPYYEAFGIDISDWAAEHCNAILKTARVTQGSITNLSLFADGYFDIICAFDALEHVDTKELSTCFSEIKRCLKKDGMFIMTTPNLLSSLIKIKKSQWHGFTDKTHVSLMEPDEWESLINSSGMNVKHKYGSGLWDIPIVPVIPKLIQKYLLAAPFIILFALGFKFPLRISDTLIVVAHR